MNDRPKLFEIIAQMAEKDGLIRDKTDKVPISPEEDYVLNEIQRIEGLPNRAKTWRWLMAQYRNISASKQIVEALKAKRLAEADLNGAIVP